MKNFKIEATANTPEIIFDIDKKTISFNGVSLPEYGGEFYDMVENQIFDFIDNIKDDLTIYFRIIYMNTSSNKRLYHIFKTCRSKISNIKIVWMYDVDDDDMKEQGEFFEQGLGIEFEYRAIQ